MIEHLRAMGYDPKVRLGTLNPLKVGRQIRERNIWYWERGPSIGYVLEGPDAIRTARKLCGATSPDRADPSSIRGRYSNDNFDLAHLEGRPCLNLVHSSDHEEEVDSDVYSLMHQKDVYKMKSVCPVFAAMIERCRKTTKRDAEMPELLAA